MKSLSMIGFLSLLSICMFLCSCTNNKVYRIGVSQCSEDDWRAKMNEEINREIMYYEDAEVEIRSAEDNSDKQIADINYFVENGFDIIVVAPNEAEKLTPIVKEVYEKGIPVIIFDRNIIGDSYTARISVDNEGLGRSAADYAYKILGRGAKALEIYGLYGSTPADERHKGFSETFSNYGGRILASVSGNWREEDSERVTDSLLAVYDDVDLIFAHNDRMAIGASTVARKAGRSKIKILGIDAAPEVGIKAVAEGVIDATFLYPTEGYRLIQTSMAILKDEDYSREVQLPSTSAVDLSNADVLLLQDEAAQAETDRMILLKQRIDNYWKQHSSQKMLFYASVAIIVLLCGLIFLILRNYWLNRQHQEELLNKNKLLEEQRDTQKLLNEKLEEATQSKLMFFTNVSHDLRTPLTLISEPVSQLSSASNLTEQQKVLMKIANKNVKILHRLINQILDFRKYENGKLELSREKVNFGVVVKDWLESFYTVARKRDIRIILNEPDDKNIVVAIDFEKMERVFFNLMSNAIKYTQPNGKVVVSYCCDRERLTFNISDTGIGIGENDLGNIFDRFYQVDKVHPNGSGIGLTLSKAFVELHGGTIYVESERGKGTAFTVVLPIVRSEDEAEDTVKAETAEDVASELDMIESEVEFTDELPLVLVIDDNQDIQTLVSSLLCDKYNVITATGGNDGIRMAMKYVPDLIICDVMMPGIDGLECCRRIKNEVSTSHIPVLMLTACTMDAQRVQCYDSGCDGYVGKPFNSVVLLSRCSSLIENRKRIKDLWHNGSSGVTDERRLLPKMDIDNDFYNRFLDIFRSVMGNPDISVDEMASKMGFERSQLYRKLKALTNYSPVELMRSIRLKEGRVQLMTTDKTVSEIAYEIGFSSPAYFTKCYRDAYGVTPTETREGK